MSITAKSAKTHDYTDRHWGHDYTVIDVRNGGAEIRLNGWGSGLSSGDYIILQSPASGSTRYKLKKVEYWRDPPDMWKADAAFAPRSVAQPETFPAPATSI